MTDQFDCVALAPALEQLKKTVTEDKTAHRRTLIFCESRFTLDIEKAVCDAIGGTFDVDVYTFRRFLSKEGKRDREMLSDQQAYMTVRSIIDNDSVWPELNIYKMSIEGKSPDEGLRPTEAARTLYNTICLMISAGITPDDLDRLQRSMEDCLLRQKLEDIVRVYRQYEAYLNGNNRGKKKYKDPNTCMRELPDCITSRLAKARTRVMFFGFQTFTQLEQKAIETAKEKAEAVTGIFIHGSEGYYIGSSSDEGAARIFSRLCSVTPVQVAGRWPEASAQEVLRRKIFNPEIVADTHAENRDKIVIKEAPNSAVELEYIAREIKSIIATKKDIRYRDIAVMVPDLEGCEADLANVFEKYNIPYFAARRYPLEAHPLCEFVLNFLSCVAYGFRPDDVAAVIASPYFPAVAYVRYKQADSGAATEAEPDGDASDTADKEMEEAVEESEKDDMEAEKDSAPAKGKADLKYNSKAIFRTYFMRFGQYNGSILDYDKELDKELCAYLHCDYNAVCAIHEKFGELYEAYKSKGTRYEKIKAVLGKVSAPFRTSIVLEPRVKEYRPEEAGVYSRIYNTLLGILKSVDDCAGTLSDAEYLEMFRNSLASAKLSGSAQNTDDVFVADFNTTMNTCTGSGNSVDTWTGSRYVFCARLTESIPNVTPDCAFLLDRDWEMVCDELDRRDMLPACTARGSNAVCRETAALNVCSFTDRLYLSYPTELDGKRTKCSEIITYAKKIFYVDSEVIRTSDVEAESSGYGLTERRGKELTEERARALFLKKSKDETKGRHVSPTTIEQYFDCPYKMFIQRGLELQEEQVGALLPLDTGLFVHQVFEGVSLKMDSVKDLDEFKAIARAKAEEVLMEPPYSALKLNRGDRHTQKQLFADMDMLIDKLYDHFMHTHFKPYRTEMPVYLSVQNKAGEEYTIYGKIDRVDVFPDPENPTGESMVRILDYKTGKYDAGETAYYMGKKLQPELYLLAAAQGSDDTPAMRPAAAYYFPCKVKYNLGSDDNLFRYAGFMDMSSEVVDASLANVGTDSKDKNKDYIAYKKSKIKDPDEFRALLNYARKVSAKAIDEMLEGYIKPSPVKDACEYCKYGGCCGYDEDVSGIRTCHYTVNSKSIADASDTTATED